MKTISALEARVAAVAASGLCLANQPRGGAVARAFGALVASGYAQIDTISAVERAHHHILWAREHRYRPDDLSRLETATPKQKRLVFEYWTHAAAYIPCSDFRYSLPRMMRIRQEGHQWFGRDDDVVARVLDRIRSEGQLESRNFGDSRESKQGWWDWKPEKRALEYLFMAGEILVVKRDGFRKIFDLAERVLPTFFAGEGRDVLDTTVPEGVQMGERFLGDAIRRLGVFDRRDVAYGVKDPKDLKDGIASATAQALERGDIEVVRVEGQEKSVYAAGTLPAAGLRHGVRILSPFDPLVIDRARLKRLFGFDFTIEFYVPQEKRQFGYFALPVLSVSAKQGPRFIGKIDAKADRPASTLLLKRVGLGTEFGGEKPGMRELELLAAEIAAYAAFNSCERIELQRVDGLSPAGEARLRAALGS